MPVPPPHCVKQYAIADARELHALDTMIETGTYLGDMVEAQRSGFKKIFSIELDEKLFSRAQKRFRKYPHIRILKGDSGEVLESVMKQVQGAAFFWLDGHYSGGITARGKKDCPIFEELDCILNGTQAGTKHVLYIDDARCFNGEGGYPTIAELGAYFNTQSVRHDLTVKDDIIRVLFL